MTCSLSSDELTAIIGQSSEAFLVTDAAGLIIYANEATSKLTGYPVDELIGRKPSLFQSGKTPHQVYEQMWKTIIQGRTWSGRLTNRRKAELPIRILGGDPTSREMEYCAFVTITPILGPTGEIRFYVGTQRDISEKAQLECRLEYEREEATARADISTIMQSKDPIHARLIRALERVVQLEGIHVQNKCGIFLIDDDSQNLNLFVTHGEFTSEFLEKEQTISLGTCLCGRVAVSGEIMVSDDFSAIPGTRTRSPG